MAKYSSYTRTILSEHQKFVQLVRKYSDPKAAIVRELDKDIKELNIITAKALADAITHPHAGFIAYTIGTLGEYLRAIRAIVEAKNDIIEEKLYIEETVRRFQDNLGNLEGGEFDKLTEVVGKLEDQYVRLIEMDNKLDDNYERLTVVIDDVVSVISQQDSEWDSYRDAFHQKIISSLDELAFPLSEIEQNEILSQDSWESMLQRVRDLKIELPKDLDVSNPSYGTYFQLKVYLAMYSSLSRRMQPSTPEEIAQL